MCADLKLVNIQAVTNRFDSVDATLMNVYFSICDRLKNPNCVLDTDRRKLFDGKQIMLLINS